MAGVEFTHDDADLGLFADRMEVYSVPRIVVDGVPQWDGSVPERVFVDRVLTPSFE